MPTLLTAEAVEKLARAVEKSKPTVLAEVQAELFPGRPSSSPSAADLARHVRTGLAAEEIVDLWNVVFPEDRNVQYDEESEAIRYNEEMVGYAE